MIVFRFLSAKRALEALRDRRIKVSTFDNLNDPFELYAADLGNRKDRQVFKKWKRSVAQSFGLLCFSRSWENPILWSHYADRHKGICLGFDVRDATPEAVTYTQTRIPLTNVEQMRMEELDSAIFERLVLTKFLGWSYEEEVRTRVRLDEMQQSSDHLYFHPFDERVRLKEVIAGHLCMVGKSEILKKIQGYRTTVKVIKARLAFKSFRVIENQHGFRGVPKPRKG